jgi:hypothetical protein
MRWTPADVIHSQGERIGRLNARIAELRDDMECMRQDWAIERSNLRAENRKLLEDADAHRCRFNEMELARDSYKAANTALYIKLSRARETVKALPHDSQCRMVRKTYCPNCKKIATETRLGGSVCGHYNEDYTRCCQVSLTTGPECTCGHDERLVAVLADIKEE